MSEAIRKAFEEYAEIKGFSLRLDAFFEGIYDSPATDKAFEVWINAYNLAKSESEQQINELMQSLKEAVEDIENWGSYASEYFQKKHNLKYVIEKHEKTIAKYS